MPIEQPNHFDERRDGIRAKRIVTVHHRLVKHKGKKVSSPWQVSMTEDMSFSGLLFVSAIAYEKGDLIEVEVVMSGILDIFKGYGEVVRQVKNKKNFYHIGLKYVDLKQDKDTSNSKKTKRSAS